MSQNAVVTQYGVRPSGTRSCQVSVGPFEVLVTPRDADDNEAACIFAQKLLTDENEAAGLRARLAAAEDVATQERRALGREVERLRALLPAKKARLYGRGCVRELRGELVLLNRRDQGWSSFGFPVADWDTLFRLYNVRVSGHGQDEAGLWWEVESMNEGATR